MNIFLSSFWYKFFDKNVFIWQRDKRNARRYWLINRSRKCATSYPDPNPRHSSSPSTRVMLPSSDNELRQHANEMASFFINENLSTSYRDRRFSHLYRFLSALPTLKVCIKCSIIKISTTFVWAIIFYC